MDTPPDLTALVLEVAPPRPTTTPGHLGRAAYALLLRLITAEEPALAEALHSSNERKPFTCSTLVGGQRRGKDERYFSPEETAWLRFTGLNADVSAHLRRLADDPPESVDLDGRRFQVHTATLDGDVHRWAGQHSYEALSAPYLLGQQKPAYRLQLSFASPTTFRSRGRSHPVPMADWVFGNLWDFWNAFSPVPLADETRRYADECVVLNRYRLRTHAVPMKANVVQMGCVGQAYYVILDRDRYWAATLNLLAEYAFYSGVGYRTTVGLGQTRRTQ
jgi:CRISPR-associated endoribonuclease Cas6